MHDTSGTKAADKKIAATEIAACQRLTGGADETRTRDLRSDSHTKKEEMLRFLAFT